MTKTYWWQESAQSDWCTVQQETRSWWNSTSVSLKVPIKYQYPITPKIRHQVLSSLISKQVHFQVGYPPTNSIYESVWWKYLRHSFTWLRCVVTRRTGDNQMTQDALYGKNWRHPVSMSPSMWQKYELSTALRLLQSIFGYFHEQP